MRLLAVETSTLTGAVALLEDRRVVAESRLGIGLTHGERLLPAIDEMLRTARCRLDEVDALAVAKGPGSFTGLRIGISTMKGLAFAIRKPLVGIPTLDALAWTLPFAAHPVCPVLDARKGEVYAALYRTQDGMLERLGPYRALAPRALAAELGRERPGPVVFVGDGVAAIEAALDPADREHARFAPAAHRAPSAVTVGELAFEALEHGEPTDPAALVPLYVRQSEAEIARERRQHAGHLG
jgi:tRNA threonylcarbamoyladenosine biosynthesis protein TsaB